MSAKKPSKVEITADLVARCLHHLDELGVPYSLCIENIPTVFSNVSPIHANAILSRQCQLNEKITDEIVIAQAEKIIDREQWPKQE